MKARCRTCGAPVIFARASWPVAGVASGRQARVALNPIPDTTGDVVMVNGEAFRATSTEAGRWSYTLHAETCPRSVRPRKGGA